LPGAARQRAERRTAADVAEAKAEVVSEAKPLAEREEVVVFSLSRSSRKSACCII